MTRRNAMQERVGTICFKAALWVNIVWMSLLLIPRWKPKTGALERRRVLAGVLGTEACGALKASELWTRDTGRLEQPQSTPRKVNSLKYTCSILKFPWKKTLTKATNALPWDPITWTPRVAGTVSHCYGWRAWWPPRHIWSRNRVVKQRKYREEKEKCWLIQSYCPK